MERLIFLTTLSIVFCTASPGLAQPQIFSFTPEAGWPGTDINNGTFVRIIGKDFALKPSDNQVLFSPRVTAKVIWSKQYVLERAFGSPGQAPGELEFPNGIDIFQPSHNPYYIEAFVANGTIIERFTELGSHIGRIANPTFKTLWGVAVDDDKAKLYATDFGKGKVYVFDIYSLSSFSEFGNLNKPKGLVIADSRFVYVVDAGSPPRVVKFDSQTNYQEVGVLSVSDRPICRPVDIAYGPTTKILYLLDQGDREPIIHRFGPNDAPLPSWRLADLVPEAQRPWAITTGAKGNLFISMGLTPTTFFDEFKRVFMIDQQGKLISQFDGMSEGQSALAISTDTFGSVYVVDNQLQSVRKYDFADRKELGVRIPPGARTGPITVTTSKGADERNFHVFDETPLSIKLDRIEVTQGLVTYPFILGKETLIWASFQGIFGHPTIDEAEVVIIQDGREKYRKSYSHTSIDLNKNKSIVHFHIGQFEVRSPGTFQFDVRFKRSGQEIAAWRSSKHEFIDTENLKILFVKLTDQPKEKWTNKSANPFGWFDPDRFYRAIRTVNRVFPVQTVEYQFAPSQYTLILENGLSEYQSENMTYFLQRVSSEFTDPAGWKPTRVVGLFDPRLMKLQNVHASVYGKEIILPFHTSYYWSLGNTLAHELGHTYGLVPKDQPNFWSNRGRHSRNPILDQEFSAGTSLMAWNSLTDLLVPVAEAQSIMFPQGARSHGFFESKASQGANLCYHHLVNQFKK